MPVRTAEEIGNPDVVSISKCSTPTAFQVSVLKNDLFNICGSSEFRSAEQFDFVFRVVFSNQDLIVIHPTGSGKSVAFLMLAQIVRSKVAIVVVPMVALVQDLLRRSAEVGIVAAKSLDGLARNTQIVFLTPESFVLESSRRVIHELHESKRISRIFIDECHMAIFDSGFREAYLGVASICRHIKGTVLLTGTASVRTQSELKALFFAEDAPVTVLRSSSNRPNLEYSVISGDFSQILPLITPLKDDERAIIYCVTILDLEKVCTKIGLNLCTAFYGELSAEEKSANFNTWRSGTRSIMVATKAFGVGIDFGKIKYVLNYGLPESFEEFAQQSGRAGRSSTIEAKSIVLIKENAEIEKLKFIKNTGDQIRLENFKKILDFGLNKSTCRRVLLSAHFDKHFSICDSKANLKCDNCLRTPSNDSSSISSQVSPLLANSSTTSPANNRHSDFASEPSHLASSSTLSQVSRVLEQSTTISPANNRHSNLDTEPSKLTSLISRNKLFMQELLNFLGLAVSSNICIVCTYKRKEATFHSSATASPCPFKNYCIGCFESRTHGIASCPMKGKDALKEKGGTFPCCKLPISIFEVSFHPIDEATKNPIIFKECKYRDLIVVLIRLINSDTTIPEEKKTFLLTKDSDGIYGCWKEFYNFMKNFGKNKQSRISFQRL